MTSAFLTGAVAGAAIAIPVGAIALLIIDLGLRRGFRSAAAAGLGAATADGLYATLAALAGAAVAGLLTPIATPLRGVVLVAVAARGLRRALASRAAATTGETAPPPAVGSTYVRFLALTLLNPHTVIYFAALTLGLPQLGTGSGERVAFVAGAFTASAAWQVFLAALAALGHRRLPERFRFGLSVFGYLLILAFALGIALDLVA
ncbi:MAG: LysE family transporter [Chloroflexi bacterium]|nr:LysE family transporter [Chloroflexota bacterium]